MSKVKFYQEMQVQSVLLNQTALLKKRSNLLIRILLNQRELQSFVHFNQIRTPRPQIENIMALRQDIQLRGEIRSE